MTGKFSSRIAETDAYVGQLLQMVPDSVKAYGGLSKAAQVNGALARGDGHPHLAGYFSHGIHVIGRDGVLQNHGAIGLHGTAKGHCLGQGHTAVHFQHEDWSGVIALLLLAIAVLVPLVPSVLAGRRLTSLS